MCGVEQIRPKKYSKGKCENFNVPGFGLPELEELPNAIGYLKCLGYLSLFGNNTIKALPNSICKLLNLQTWTLVNCEQHQELCRDLGRLISLKSGKRPHIASKTFHLGVS
ncbi:hypothetical protein F0562_017514 [Nyssa sinensis]|uniref:Leucine-rich repeat-containing N-terminal plant-type domain-containing protein n=1 Tax=Nyssa sinensis TaxID=561372 RepID=A0A5J4ZH89_9ASTE|nr:hypothetical protein F0562_017514 [Nyssa sinensis]